MKSGYVIALLLLLTACKTDQEIQLEAQEKASLRFQELDKSQLDAYPLFDGCDEMVNNADCFYSHLQQLINDRLAMCDLDLQLAARDSVVASVTVLKSGQIRYDSILQPGLNHIAHKKIDSLLQSRLAHLPAIQSALKQDIPVTSSYLLPIVLTPAIDPLDQ